MTKKSLLRGFLHAAGVLIYVSAVSWILFNAKEIFGEPPGFFAPLLMLLLLIISATITGLLVLGKPAHLYFTGAKKEAVYLLLITLGWLILSLAALVALLLTL